MIERHEEILEAIYKTGEKNDSSIDSIRKNCEVEITEEDLLELEKQNMIVRTDDKILFSKKGKKIAEHITRRHRLAEVLLSSILKLKNSKMEELACKIEHTLLPEVEEAICTLLGHPQVCPDGKPIAKGRCCERGVRTVDNVVTSLDTLSAGESGRVTYIKPSNHAQLHQLLSFGLNPGIDVSVHRTSPALCLKFENTELALDKEIAKNIFVVRHTSNRDS